VDGGVRAPRGAPAVEVPRLQPVPLPRVPGRGGHRGVPPRLGEHGAEVLREAGYDAGGIEALRAAGGLGEGTDSDTEETAS